MKFEMTAAAVRDLGRLDAAVRESLLGALTELANDPDHLDRSAFLLDGDEADVLDLPPDAVTAAAGGRLKAIGITIKGRWLSRPRPSIHVYCTAADQTLAVLAVSEYEPAAIG